MPSFPISNSSALGLGQTGGPAQAPALVQGVGLVVSQNTVPSSAVWLYPWSASDPAALTGQIPSGFVFGTGAYAGQIYAVNDAGAPVMVIDNGALVGTLVVDSLDLGTNDPINFGAADNFVVKYNGSVLLWTQAAADSTMDFGVIGAGINVQLYGDTEGRDCLWDQTNDRWLWNDNAKAVFGTGGDLSVYHDGTNTLVNSITGNLILDNQAVTGATYLDLGTDTSATSFAVRNNTGAAKLSVDGAGTVTVADGSTLFVAGAGTGTGDIVQVYGPDITHGWARYVYQADITPAATETALFTVPAMSRLLVVQANAQSALTGGGTTVTFSIGITGDVDAYGTASNSGVQADLLTQNAKINAMAGIAANAGASLGVFSAATVALKLCAAAAGGNAAGDTALSVGTVRIRVMYETLLPLANA